MKCLPLIFAAVLLAGCLGQNRVETASQRTSDRETSKAAIEHLQPQPQQAMASGNAQMRGEITASGNSIVTAIYAPPAQIVEILRTQAESKIKADTVALSMSETSDGWYYLLIAVSALILLVVAMVGWWWLKRFADQTGISGGLRLAKDWIGEVGEEMKNTTNEQEMVVLRRLENKLKSKHTKLIAKSSRPCEV